MTTTTEERVMRCEVTGGFVELRYRHNMSAEDVGDLISYLDILRRHLEKRATPKGPRPLPPPSDDSPGPRWTEGG
jgi:hypothetical protein